MSRWVYVMAIFAKACLYVPSGARAQAPGSASAGGDAGASEADAAAAPSPPHGEPDPRELAAPKLEPPRLIEPTDETAAEATASAGSGGDAANQPVEVMVVAQMSAAKRLQTSSQAVTVVKLGDPQKRSSDLGEVVSRVPGVSIRRMGSLGSDFRLSMNGLYDAQVRVYIDGIPIELMIAQGLANVPIGLLEHMEVYRGVVPIRLGSDALGGALNPVRADNHETGAQASYQVGSFGIHRAMLAGSFRHDKTGLIARVDAFFDAADNDYLIAVEVPDELGRLSLRRVRRFHDGYRGYGVSAELGVVDKPWARALLLRAFASASEKELQHNPIMTIPYGEAHYGERLSGALIRYENRLWDRVDLDLVGTYAYRTVEFVDKSRWAYDWLGNRIRERPTPGETTNGPIDVGQWQHGGFARGPPRSSSPRGMPSRAMPRCLTHCARGTIG